MRAISSGRLREFLTFLRFTEPLVLSPAPLITLQSNRLTMSGYGDVTMPVWAVKSASTA